MIINVGTRTDLVMHYGEWLMNRFHAGYVYSRNALFSNKVTRYELTPEKVDAIAFCSKDYRPFLQNIPYFTSRFRTYFQYTITAYGKDIEPRIPSVNDSIDTFKELSKLVGPERLVWRYTPVLITSTYTAKRHAETFAYIASKLRGAADHCVVGFVEPLIRLQSSIPDIIFISDREKAELAASLKSIADRIGIPFQLCGSGNLYEDFGMEKTGCCTLAAIGKANGCFFRKMPHAGMRRGCLCITSREIGAYESCPNLCKYCFANTSPEQVRENRKLHDVNSPLLIGHCLPKDTLRPGSQMSYLKNDGRQISIFDL